MSFVVDVLFNCLKITSRRFDSEQLSFVVFQGPKKFIFTLDFHTAVVMQILKLQN